MSATNDLFNFDKIEHQQSAILVMLSVCKDSRILKGHFPGHPVVPGACMLQVVKEVLENSFNRPLILKKADQLKFMAMIDPSNTQTVQLDIDYKSLEDGSLAVNAKLSYAEVVHFKFQGSFVFAGASEAAKGF
jgi:3-hydroxyacyl-[acyl-carrier-protein] dehydratase